MYWHIKYKYLYTAVHLKITNIIKYIVYVLCSRNNNGRVFRIDYRLIDEYNSTKWFRPMM